MYFFIPTSSNDNIDFPFISEIHTNDFQQQKRTILHIKYWNFLMIILSVKSFGTEDRETQFPVAPQNQVYEYILFRGSDIKDIRIVNTVSSLPNDPAIVQVILVNFVLPSNKCLDRIDLIDNNFSLKFFIDICQIVNYEI